MTGERHPGEETGSSAEQAEQEVRRRASHGINDDSWDALPFVRLLRSRAEAREVYDRLLGEAELEILTCNRPPYSVDPGQVNPSVLAALGRGVRIRALYQAAQLGDPEAEAFRRTMDAYDEAGVVGRVVIDLPIQLAIVDRRASLLAMPDPRVGDGVYSSVVLIEHPGFSAVQAYAFEQLWAAARPYRRPRRTREVAVASG